MGHIKSKADRDRVRTRSTQKQIRKGLLARLAVRGIHPENGKTAKLDELRRLIEEHDKNQEGVEPMEGVQIEMVIRNGFLVVPCWNCDGSDREPDGDLCDDCKEPTPITSGPWGLE